MAERTTHTRGADAPLTTAKNPDAHAAGLEADRDADELLGRTVSINRPRQELYDFWRDFRNLPLFMENIESVTILDGNRSHWKVRGPANSDFEWDSVITEDVPGEVIAWSSVEGAGVENAGRVEFRDSSNDRGTIVIVISHTAGMAERLEGRRIFMQQGRISRIEEP